MGAGEEPDRARRRIRSSTPTDASFPFVDADGIDRKLVANPVQFDETPPSVTRGPLFAEHTEDILHELGKSDDDIRQAQKRKAPVPDCVGVSRIRRGDDRWSSWGRTTLSEPRS